VYYLKVMDIERGADRWSLPKMRPTSKVSMTVPTTASAVMRRLTLAQELWNTCAATAHVYGE